LGKIAASFIRTLGGDIKIGRDQFQHLAIKSSIFTYYKATRGSLLPLNAVYNIDSVTDSGQSRVFTTGIPAGTSLASKFSRGV